MKGEIGSIAGKIWQILKEKDEMNLTQIPKAVNVKPVIAYQALGWLARENKIVYKQKGNTTLISLNE